MIVIVNSFLITFKHFIFSFPGGKVDKEDNSIVDAALRETEEELGINKRAIEVWVEAFPIPDRVNTFVYMYHLLDNPKLPANLCAGLFCLPRGV